MLPHAHATAEHGGHERHARRVRRALLAPFATALAGVLVLSACSNGPVEDATPAPHVTAPTSAPPSAVPLDTSTIQSIIDTADESPVLTVTGTAPSIAGETAHAVTYTSGDLDVTGVIRTPPGEGPFPAVTVVHGAVNPETYTSGGDLLPEQRALLDAGYVVFALDMRGYAGSDDADLEEALAVDPGFGWLTVLDWGMALDVVNALQLLRAGDVDNVDPTRVGLLGHSLGGLLSLDAAVIAPGSSDLVIALSAPASDFGELFASLDETSIDGLEEALEEIGTPSENPQYWADISPRQYFDRATEPLLLIHGGADTTTLPEWSEDTAEAWRATGKRSEAIILDGADHLLSGRRNEAGDIIVAAFDEVLRTEP